MVSFIQVLSILVSYYNPGRKAVDVEHLGSFEVLKVTTATLENALDKFFTDNDIPWSNMVSMMMDSCAVMRGSKSGLETRVRHNHCPELLDIDGDSCHHMHNASKRFSSAFNGHLEQLFSDLHTDHKWASDQVNSYRSVECLCIALFHLDSTEHLFTHFANGSSCHACILLIRSNLGFILFPKDIFDRT